MTVATRPIARKPVRVGRESLYSEPISSCNRKCKMCYTHVVNGLERTLVDPYTMHHFVQRFLAVELEQVCVIGAAPARSASSASFPAWSTGYWPNSPKSG